MRSRVGEELQQENSPSGKPAQSSVRTAKSDLVAQVGAWQVGEWGAVEVCCVYMWVEIGWR